MTRHCVGGRRSSPRRYRLGASSLATALLSISTTPASLAFIAPPTTSAGFVNGRHAIRPSRGPLLSPLRVDVRTSDGDAESSSSLDKAVAAMDEKRYQERKQKEVEINRLKLQLNSLRDSIAEGEKRAAEAESRVKDLRKEGDSERSTNTGLIAMIKKQFEEEKVKLLGKLRASEEDMEKAKAESEEMLAKARNETEERMGEMMLNIEAMEASLKATSKDVVDKNQEMKDMQSEHEEQMTKDREESDRVQRAIKSVTFHEKKELQRKAYKMQKNLDQATLDLTVVWEEVKELKSTRGALEEELAVEERALSAQITELQKEIKDNRSCYETSKRVAQEKQESIVTALKERISETEKDAEMQVRVIQENATWEMDKLAKKTTKEKIAIYQDKFSSLAQSREEREAGLDEAEARLKVFREDAEKNLHQTKVDAERKIAAVQEDMYGKLSDVKAEAERQKLMLVLDKDAALATLKEKSDRQINEIRTAVTQQLFDVIEEQRELEGQLREKKILISTHEGEQKSLRKLAGLTWKLTKNRTRKLPSKVRNLVSRRK